MTLRAELPVQRNKTLYSRLVIVPSSIADSMHYCVFDAEQQALVEDADGAQQESASDGFDTAARGAVSFPYTVFSPKV